MPSQIKLLTARSLPAIAAICTLGFAPGAAIAQLATSPAPAPVRVPEVVVTAPAGPPAQTSPRPPKAPAAAEQSSTPRAAKKPAVASSTPSAASVSTAPAPVAVEPEPVTVAPTGSTTPVDQVASSVTVITSQEIDAQQRRAAPELLRSVPGTNVVQTGGPGGLTSVFIRGAESRHTKVLIDGIDASDPGASGRSFDFGQLSTFDIDRVEVLRGPQSGLYGADALGGVIVVYTKKGEGPLKVEVLGEAGSFGTLNEAVSARGSTDRFNYAVSISHLRSDRNPITPVEILAPGARRIDNRNDTTTYSTKLGYDFSNELSVNVAARYIDSVYGFQNSFRTSDRAQTDRQQLFTRGEAVWSLPGGLVKNYFGINYTDIATDNASPTFPSKYNGQRVKYDWRTVAAVTRGVTVTVGADYQIERLTSPDNPSSPALGVEEDNRGIYVQAQIEPVANFFIAANLRRDTNENFGDATTWRVAPTYTFAATGTKIKGSAGTAFRAPSLSDRFQNFPDPFFPFLGNPNLRPETSKGYDIGFEQPLLANRAQVGATYFYNDIKDLIQTTFDDVTFVSSVANVGRARTWGLEAFASADVTDTVRVRADYTYTKAYDIETALDLLRRPRHKATVSAGWKVTDPLLLTASLTYLGETFDNDRVLFERVRQSGFTLVNVAADYKLNANLSLFGRIDNLFDRHYQSPNGYDGTGLGAFAGVRITN
jgi:vitamin B12 transporter